MGGGKDIKKTILIIVGLLLALGVMLLAGSRVYNLLAKAGGSSQPDNVQITQITANSAVVTFTTASSKQTLIEYGTDSANLTLFANDTETTDHKISLSLLTPNTSYFLHIKIDGKVYDNGGVPWTFTTSGTNLPTLKSPTTLPSLAATLVPKLSPASSSAQKISCGEVAKRIGSTKGSPNYDVKYDLNSDGIINSADMALCGK